MFSRLLCTHITDFPGVPVFYHRHLTVEILDFDLGTAWDTVPRFQGEGKGLLIASGSDKKTFSFTLKARDRIPGSAKVKVQYFNGQVTMVKDGNTWKISDMSAKKTGEHVE